VDQILFPLEWAIAAVLVGFHTALTFLGMDEASGWTWAAAIVGLVIVIRILLIPLFVRQIKSSRAMQVISPDLRKIQDKYKGKKDAASREAMGRETMELYSKHGTSPFASCLPLLIQMPIFFALFRVLNNKLDGGIGLLTPELASLADNSTFLGAALSETFLATDSWNVRIVTIVLIIAMVSTTFLTQRQLTRKNMPAAALEGPMAQQQKVLLYVLPFVFVLSGPFFPIGVLIYWTTTNLWTMGQQFYVIRNNPTPGSEAEKAFLERKRAKDEAKGIVDTVEEVPAIEEAPQSRQRKQPQRKNRRKK